MVFKHGDLAIIDGRKAYFGTVTGYAALNGKDVRVAYDRAEKHKHELRWIGLEASVLCADKGYYEHEQAKWANVPRLSTGDTVTVADAFDVLEFVIKPAPNRNFALVPK